MSNQSKCNTFAKSTMKASKSLFFILFLLIGLFYSSCQRPITGEGELIKESRAIKSFNNLVLNIPAHVSILVTDSNSLAIVAQENIVENIDIKSKKKVELREEGCSKFCNVAISFAEPATLKKKH